jgi:hypothetical protein
VISVRVCNDVEVAVDANGTANYRAMPRTALLLPTSCCRSRSTVHPWRLGVDRRGSLASAHVMRKKELLLAFETRTATTATMRTVVLMKKKSRMTRFSGARKRTKTPDNFNVLHAGP